MAMHERSSARRKTSALVFLEAMPAQLAIGRWIGVVSFECV
jgi:hypothetical protein